VSCSKVMMGAKARINSGENRVILGIIEDCFSYKCIIVVHTHRAAASSSPLDNRLLVILHVPSGLCIINLNRAAAARRPKPPRLHAEGLIKINVVWDPWRWKPQTKTDKLVCFVQCVTCESDFAQIRSISPQ
jgi:hypothetical protein